MCELDCSDLAQKHTHTNACIPNLEHPVERYFARVRAYMCLNNHIEEKATLARRMKKKNSRMLELTRHTVGARYSFRISKRFKVRLDTLDGLLWQNVSNLPDVRLHPMDGWMDLTHTRCNLISFRHGLQWIHS